MHRRAAVGHPGAPAITLFAALLLETFSSQARAEDRFYPGIDASDLFQDENGGEDVSSLGVPAPLCARLTR